LLIEAALSQGNEREKNPDREAVMVEQGIGPGALWAIRAIQRGTKACDFPGLIYFC